MNSSSNPERVWKTDHFRAPHARSWSDRLNWDMILATVAIVAISAAGWSAIGAAISHFVQ
ncbi:MAG: hypothetical protein ABJA69_06545 [Acidobacteriaceae bacterium]